MAIFISHIQQTNSGRGFQLVLAAQPRRTDAIRSVVFASLCRGGPPLFIVTLFPCGRSVWAEHKPQRSVYMLNITVAWACGLQHGRKEPAHTDVTAGNEPRQCCPCAVNRHNASSDGKCKSLTFPCGFWTCFQWTGHFWTIIMAFDVRKRNATALLACLMAFESEVLCFSCEDWGEWWISRQWFDLNMGTHTQREYLKCERSLVSYLFSICI